MRSPAWPLLLLALTPALACSNDDTENTTGASNDESDDATASETSDPRAECLDNAPRDTTDGSTTTIMDRWGAPCSNDAECVALIGEGGVCDRQAVIYELPGGYCTKPCTLPDANTTVVLDAPDCDPAGGVACVGRIPIYARCAVPCTDDAQCERDGYICRLMPTISQPDDIALCLMPDCCQSECG